MSGWLVAGLVAAVTAGCSSHSIEPSTGAGPTAGVPSGPFVAANVAVAVQPDARVNGSPLSIAAPNDGSGRLFVATQDGRIWSIANGAVDPAPMLDISAEITSGGERGLLGLALDPKFPARPRVYVDYTDTTGNTIVASFDLADAATAGPGGNVIDPHSERRILEVDQPFPNHKGGNLAFGPDGRLYITLGDGGSEGDPNGNGQNLGALLAKVLRIDVSAAGTTGRAYAVPADNPFVSRAGARPEIWLYGLRNPWRVSFDRATGDFWIGDVGQDRWEEVDVVRAGDPGGENFGWSVMEGNHCYRPPDGCSTTGMTAPVTEYGHDEGCAVIGGYVYRGSAYPMLVGGYLFSDSCSGTIWAIPAATTTLTQPVAVGKVTGSPAGFGQDAAGELYIATLDGTISKVTATSR